MRVQVDDISCYARAVHQRIVKMNEDICMVTYFPGSMRNEPEIEVEMRKGTSYTLKGEEANIETIVAKLADKGWKLEQHLEGTPEIFIFFQHLPERPWKDVSL